jgi:tRNA-splicing ligase RtcB
VDWDQIWDDLDRVYDHGGRSGDAAWLPSDLLEAPWRRDPVLGTIGGGNHFVELLEVADVLDTRTAYRWGVRPGQLAFMIHSGSRTVGKAIGDAWRRRTRAEWPEGVAQPEVLSLDAASEACSAYLEAENTAANFGWLNRFVLAEVMRRRLRTVFGDVAAPLVFDLPHNITERRGAGFVTRKGACPAHPDQPVIIPGSMGASSFLMAGCGSGRFLESASHGAGRAVTRFELGRRGSRFRDATSLGLDGVTCITLKAERRIEEAPAAYKPIGPVIEARVAAGVVRPVARMEPLVTFKG